MSDPKIVETRRIPVQNGLELEVEMTQEFIDRMKQHFGIFDDQPLEDDQVRMYVWGAVNTAVSKAEQGVTKDVKATESPGRVRRPRRRKTGKRS